MIRGKYIERKTKDLGNEQAFSEIIEERDNR